MSDNNQEYEPNIEAAVINAVSDEIGQWAQGHGFREGWEMADSLVDLAQRIDMNGKITDHDVSMLSDASTLMRNLWVMSKLMLIVTEVSEAVDPVRKHGVNGILAGEDGRNFGEELADIMIRVGDLSHNMSVPVGDHTMAKVEKNKTRPFKHGKTL